MTAGRTGWARPATDRQPPKRQLPNARPGDAQRLTRDDSLAEEMVAAGLLPEDEALSSPHAHVVTRWVGADPGEATPHVVTFEPPGPGVLMLCSDGLWNYQPDAGKLAELALPAALTDPLAAAQALVTFAIEAGGRDNITVVLAPFPPGALTAPGTCPARAPERSAQHLGQGHTRVGQPGGVHPGARVPGPDQRLDVVRSRPRR